MSGCPWSWRSPDRGDRDMPTRFGYHAAPSRPTLHGGDEVAPVGPSSPEARTRVRIDAALVASGWLVQDRDDMNVAAARGVAVREFKLKQGHGFADYLLFVD